MLTGRTALGHGGLALLLLCAPSLVAAQSPSPAPGDPLAGARLFRARGCVECHAADLASLRREPRPLYALAAALWNHFPRMADRIRAASADRPYFTSAEMMDLVAFLAAGESRGPAPDESRLLGPAGDPAWGRRLVADKGCLVCHSLAPPGGKWAGSLADLKGLDTPWSVVAQMWNHMFLMQIKTEEQRRAWARLGTDEMADLVAYLQALMRGEGG